MAAAQQPAARCTQGDQHGAHTAFQQNLGGCVDGRVSRHTGHGAQLGFVGGEQVDLG